MYLVTNSADPDKLKGKAYPGSAEPGLIYKDKKSWDGKLQRLSFYLKLENYKP